MANILVVDDDDSILDAISTILEEEGHYVTTTLKGQSIFNEIKKLKPDLILLDVLLSGIDGRDICKKLKSGNGTKKIPVIMISAHPSAAKTIKDSGADFFIPKPFGLDELVNTVNRFLN